MPGLQSPPSDTRLRLLTCCHIAGDIKQGDIKQGDIKQGDIKQGDIKQGEISSA
jgi:hypothetical protein